jgi:hypothetical protein
MANHLSGTSRVRTQDYTITIPAATMTQATQRPSSSPQISDSVRLSTSEGISTTLGKWISDLVDTIRGCLAKLPLIGYLFSKEEPGTTTRNSTTITGSDGDLLQSIRDAFPEAPGAPTVSEETILRTLGEFGRIANPRAKMYAFGDVLAARNSTDEIGQRFYRALPADMQDRLRHHIYLANNSVDNGLGDHFGHHIIDTAIRSTLVHTAVSNYRGELA